MGRVVACIHLLSTAEVLKLRNLRVELGDCRLPVELAIAAR